MNRPPVVSIALVLALHTVAQAVEPANNPAFNLHRFAKHYMYGTLTYQVAEDAEKYFKDLVFKTVIPRNIRLSEAPSFGKPILLYDATSAGARSYFDLAVEISGGPSSRAASVL